MRIFALLALLPAVTAGDCDCLTQWTHNSGSGDETYEGCQTTKDGMGYPWCKVLDTCTTALTGYDSTQTAFKYINCWEGTNPYVTCECADACTDDAVSPYCSVKVAPCASAPEPVPGKVAYMTCVPDACKCKDNWTFGGKAYTGCSSTPEGDSPNIPWCEVDASCLHAHPANGTLPRFRYCDDYGTFGSAACECKPNTCQNTAYPRCEVTTPCYGTPPSSDSTVGYMACSPTECTCEATWDYNGATYKGCSVTTDSPHQAWCQTGSACLSEQVTVSTDSKRWIQCTDPNACDCLNSWTHNGETYTGCQTTPDSPSTPWCKVTAACSKGAPHYDGNTLDYHWVTCTSGSNQNQECECTNQCVNAKKAYCTVTKACLNVPAPAAPQTVGYAHCVPSECECKATWSFEGQNYGGCTETPGHTGFWCLVTGDSSCLEALPVDASNTAAGYWRQCETRENPPPPTSNCSCLANWDYNGASYTGCRTTPDSPNTPWCVVSADCPDIAVDSSVGFKWTLCYEGLDYNKVCECKPNTCTDLQYGTPYCAVSNAPCSGTPIADANNEAYASCTPDACKCLDNWSYNGKAYSGCVTTEDSPGTAWCAVSSTCMNADSTSIPGMNTRYCIENIDYSKTCSCGTNQCVNAAQPYCQAVNAPCDSSPPAGLQGAFVSCFPEECKKCDATGCQLNTTDPLGYVSNWCTLIDNSGCMSAGDKTDGKKWAYCEPAASCECLSSWTYQGTMYSGCSTTPDHTTEWCMVNNNCIGASYGNDGTNYKWMSCGTGVSEVTPPPTPSGACSCLASWESNGATYTYCRTTPDSPGQAWCKVSDTCTEIATDTTLGYKWTYCYDGIDINKACECEPNTCVDTDSGTPYCSVANAPCATSPVADTNNKAYAQCTPESCKCLDTWTYNSKTYAGCVTTPDSPGYAWCAVQSTCKSADSTTYPGLTTRYCLDGLDYTKTCSCGTNMCANAAVPYCSVVNAPCDSSPPAGTQGAYTTCIPAECKRCSASWTHGGQTYQGCTTGITDPLGNINVNWCILEDEACLSAGDVDGKKWAYCEPSGSCDCMSQWTYGGATYNGCSTTPDSEGEWCKVSSSCLEASYTSDGSSYVSCGSSVTPGGPCSCLPSWEYSSYQFSGCVTTIDSPGQPWCRVSDSCKEVEVDSTYGFKWMSCYNGLEYSTTCECKPGTCVDTDLTSGLTPYCIASNTPCATAPVPAAQHDAYVQCTPEACKCLESWTYKGKQYSGCVTTDDSPSAAWCVVGPDCKSADKTTDPLLPRRYCLDGIDYSKVCSCGSNQCTNAANPYCTVVNAPCAVTPDAPTGAYMNCIPEECKKCATSWTQGGATYEGCAKGLTDPFGSEGSNWCVLDDNAGCLSAGDTADGKKWAYCEPSPTACDCLSSWTYQLIAYSGCSKTSDSSTEWCMVSNDCLSAAYGNSGDQVYSWKSCGASAGAPMESEDEGLSGGAIAGIIIAVIVAVALIVAAVFFALKGKKEPENGEAMGHELIEPQTAYKKSEME
eukprot:TRINITY_DN12731_c1_g1_i1.p1 TRINITY_DN12731_c1_g1~~TRINITY_DN12731_c1_g1_i1.p1  ORF type:complete len:1508 (+),score=298.44 TRINITY_DN12731_c1_g1_i1:127-4650(+)